MVALVLWALVFPANTNETLGSLNSSLLKILTRFYIVIVGFFAFFPLPKTGSRVMGVPGQRRTGATA